jgi:uncharacterized membrane protein YfcA
VAVKEHEVSRTVGPSRGRRALCGWSPPSPVADTAFKRRVDLLRIGNAASIGLVVVVVGLLNLADHLPIRPALGVDALVGFVAGGWCSLNFWRCRHAHCLITGPGWQAFGLFALVEASLGRSLIGRHEQPLFLGILGIAVIFEASWYAVSHTNAIARPPSADTSARPRG